MSLTCIHVSYSLPEAQIVASRLRAAGFEPLIQGGHHASVSPHYLVALGGIQILVPAQEAAPATELVSAAIASAGIPATPESEGCWQQPVRNALLGVAAFLLTGLPFAPWRAAGPNEGR